MSQLSNDQPKPFQFNWQSSSNTSTTTSTTNNNFTNQNTNQFNFFPNNFKPNTNQTQSIKDSNNSPKWDELKFAFNETNPFTFDFKDNNENDTNNSISNNNNENNNSLNFAFANVSIQQKRNIKFPNFKQILPLNDEIESLEMEINGLALKLSELKNKKNKLNNKRKLIQNDIKKWYLNWKLWVIDDFVHWVFEEIDNGYFKYKQNVNNIKFNKNEFINKLQIIIHRFNKNNNNFIGEYIIKFDILDIKELFTFLNGDDCRKLYNEMQKLIADEKLKQRYKISECCSICMENQKQFALNCGHVFCKKCVDKMKVCPLCKKTIQKNKMIKIFL